VLGLLAASRLAELYPNSNEGDLAPRLNAWSAARPCAVCARRESCPALRRPLPAVDQGGGGRDKKESNPAAAGEADHGGGVDQDGGLPSARAVFSTSGPGRSKSWAR